MKRGQIWIETVIYILIALAMIGAVLAFVIPRIEEIQDKAIIEQSINVMKDIDNIILSTIQGGPGNKRIIDLVIKKGALKINSNQDNITFEIESDYTYSQPGEDINIGNIVAKTEKTGSTNKITLTRNYNYNLTYKGKEELKTISQASTPYILSIENKGIDNNGKAIIDITVS